jgi:hypothetical protein
MRAMHPIRAARTLALGGIGLGGLTVSAMIIAILDPSAARSLPARAGFNAHDPARPAMLHFLPGNWKASWCAGPMGRDGKRQRERGRPRSTTVRVRWCADGVAVHMSCPRSVERFPLVTSPGQRGARYGQPVAGIASDIVHFPGTHIVRGPIHRRSTLSRVSSVRVRGRKAMSSNLDVGNASRGRRGRVPSAARPRIRISLDYL